MKRRLCHRVLGRRTRLLGMIAGLAMSGSLLSAQGSVAIRDADAANAKRAQELLARAVTVNVARVSRRHAIELLAKSGHVVVQYRYALLDAFPDSVNVHVTNVPLGVALEQVLSGTGLRVVPDAGKRLSIVAADAAVDSVPAVGTISGRVVDSASGKGIGGATVKVQGTKLSALSSDSGRFILRNVPVGNQLMRVHVFGHRPITQEVTVTSNEAAIVRMTMTPLPNVLSGVVTTATGVQRKMEVGNDITTLNVDSVMRVAPVMSVTDLLETRVPGLTVLRSSGSPGDPSRIRVRGASSINGNNDPIVIVDGVRVYSSQSDARNDNLAPSVIGRNTTRNGQNKGPGYAAPSPIDQIDPSSIETIEVLKGPSASALYGSDAANGVIVITTKRGRAGPTHVNGIVGFGMHTEPGDWPTNYYRFGFGVKTPVGVATCEWNDQTCAQDSIVAFQALNDPQYTVFADHGSDQTYSATVTGGVTNLSYSLTGSSNRQVGLLKLPGVEIARYQKFYNQDVPGWMRRPQNYATWSISGQLTAQPTSAIQTTFISSLFNSNQQNSSLQDAINQLQGIYVDRGQLAQRPLLTQFVERALAHQVTSNNSATVSWRAASWLPIQAQGGISIDQRTDQTLVPYGINSASAGVCQVGCGTADTTGSYGLGRGTSQVNTLNLNTNIPVFRERIMLALGSNYTSQSTSDFQASTRQLAPGIGTPSNFPTNGVNGIGSPSSFNQTTAEGATYGVYTQARIHVFGSMYLNPGFRLDGGSASGKNASLGAAGISGLTGFPKIDLSYIVVDPSHPRGTISLFRPRVAFGKAGTQPGPLDRLRLLNGDSLTSLNGDTNYVQNVVLSTLGNTQLQPERSDELEGGFDVELWQGRLSTRWTGSRRVRHNAIISIPVAPSVFGVQSIFTNIGVIRETTNELSIDAQVLRNRLLGWQVSGTFSRQRNLVESLNKGQSTIDLGGGTRVEAGYPLFGRWALPIATFFDSNGDGLIESDELRTGDSAVYVGEQTPNYEMTLGTSVQVGRFSLTANFSYMSGLTQFNDGALTSGAFAVLGNRPGTSLATQAAIVAATGGGVCSSQPGYFYYENNDITNCVATTNIGVIQTVNSLRFNSLSINYAVPRGVSQWFRVPSMNVALQGSNLGLRTNYHGKDPNVNAFSTSANGDATKDLGQLPLPRTWWLKFSLGNN